MAGAEHSFGRKTFHKPTYCHHCSDLLWGLIGQGYICEVCNFIVHDKCEKNVITPCLGVAPYLIRNPVAHCWSEPEKHHKRKFCSVCRKRLDETSAVHCLICEYFAHAECQDFAIPDCKENATYVPGKELGHVKHQHHWREGNLPQSSKCAHCKKACWSYECLTGYRCEWCGTTTHGGCRNNIPSECTFGTLQPIYLPPHAVSIPRTEVPMEAIIGVQNKNKGTPGMQRDYSCPRSISEEMYSDPSRCDDQQKAESSSGTHSKPDSAHKDKDKKDKEKEERDEETIKVFDGNCSYRRKIFRAITVPRTCSLEQLLTTALRAFHIARDSNLFFLTDVYGDEVRLQDPTPVLNLHRIEGKRPAIYLRFRDRENDHGFVRVYPGKLQVENAYVNIPVDLDSTVKDLIGESLKKFGLEGLDPPDGDDALLSAAQTGSARAEPGPLRRQSTSGPVATELRTHTD